VQPRQAIRFDRKRLAASWTKGAAIVRHGEDCAAGLVPLALVSKITGRHRSTLSRGHDDLYRLTPNLGSNRAISARLCSAVARSRSTD
jgi:hypothetical protein